MKKLITFVPVWLFYFISQVFLQIHCELETLYEIFKYKFNNPAPFYLFMVFGEWSFNMKEWSGMQKPWNI